MTTANRTAADIFARLVANTDALYANTMTHAEHRDANSAAWDAAVAAGQSVVNRVHALIRQQQAQ